MNNITSTMALKSESEISRTHNNKEDDVITITEKIKLKKDQYGVLKIICGTYQTSFSEYIQEALIEAMKFDIEEGNFCDVLLGKIIDEDDDEKKDNNSSSPAPTSMNNELDMLKKLQM